MSQDPAMTISSMPKENSTKSLEIQDENDAMENDLLLENGEDEGSLDEVDEFENLFFEGSLFAAGNPPTTTTTTSTSTISEKQDCEVDSLTSVPVPPNAVKPESSQDSAFKWLSPMTYVQLLVYPDGYAEYQNGLVKPSITILREAHFVRQRRKFLIVLTLYLMIMRCTSWDAFFILLLLSYAFLLYYLKHARQWNMYLAKKNWKQRVGWARQWVGGLFSKSHAGIPQEESLASAGAGVGAGAGAMTPLASAPLSRTTNKKPKASAETRSGTRFLRGRRLRKQAVDDPSTDTRGVGVLDDASSAGTVAEPSDNTSGTGRSATKTEPPQMPGFGIVVKAKGLWSHVKPGSHATLSVTPGLQSSSSSSTTVPEDPSGWSQSLNTPLRSQASGLTMSSSDSQLSVLANVGS